MLAKVPGRAEVGLADLGDVAVVDKDDGDVFGVDDPQDPGPVPGLVPIVERHTLLAYLPLLAVWIATVPRHVELAFVDLVELRADSSDDGQVLHPLQEQLAQVADVGDPGGEAGGPGDVRRRPRRNQVFVRVLLFSHGGG